MEFFFLSILFRFCLASDEFIVPLANLASAPYAEWAHYHWVWLSNDRATQNDTITFANDFLDHDIAVGAVDCDSGWETGFNSLVFDSTKYPNTSDMVSTLHGQGIRVIFWITSMIDVDSPNYGYALEQGYFIMRENGDPAKYNWWHGTGSLLDYSNPAALKYWHSLMDPVLATGIDGWKCDGTDPYILESPDAMGYAGHISYRDYADAYYGDFFDYTQSVNGKDCLIMSRPVDGVTHTPFYLAFSPHRVMFSGWTGDDDPDFGGLKSALTKFMYSAELNYTNFGTDIGGYRDDTSSYGPLGRPKNTFIRWFQVCAFVPLMENGGNGEHRPWMFDDANSTMVVDTYRIFVTAHYEINPYLLDLGTTAFESNRSALKPVEKLNLTDDFPQVFDFFLGDGFLVNPMVENDTVRLITFPGPADQTYTSYWDPTQVYKGNTTVLYPCPWETFPVWIVGTSILPLHIYSDLTGRGSSHFANFLTILLNRPKLDGSLISKNIREFGEKRGLIVSYQFNVSSQEIEISTSGFVPPSPSAKLKRKIEHNYYDDLIIVIEGVCMNNNWEILQKQKNNENWLKLNLETSLEKLSQQNQGYHYDSQLTRLTIRPYQAEKGVKLRVHHKFFHLCENLQ